MPTYNLSADQMVTKGGDGKTLGEDLFFAVVHKAGQNSPRNCLTYYYPEKGSFSPHIPCNEVALSCKDCQAILQFLSHNVGKAQAQKDTW